LRLENDWETLPQHFKYRVAQYQQAIEIILKHNSSIRYVYIAAGEINEKGEIKTERLLPKHSNLKMLSKSACLEHEVLAGIPLEFQAAVDSIVLVELGHFVGCAPSSFSYFVWEMRNFHGLHGLMIRKPGHLMWHPIYAPPLSHWRSVVDPEPEINEPASGYTLPPFSQKNVYDSVKPDTPMISNVTPVQLLASIFIRENKKWW